jgi:hypothetical protein
MDLGGWRFRLLDTFWVETEELERHLLKRGYGHERAGTALLWTLGQSLEQAWTPEVKAA